MNAIYIVAYLVGYVYFVPRIFRWVLEDMGDTDKETVLVAGILAILVSIFWPLFPLVKLFDMFVLTPFTDYLSNKEVRINE